MNIKKYLFWFVLFLISIICIVDIYSIVKNISEKRVVEVKDYIMVSIWVVALYFVSRIVFAKLLKKSK